MCRKIRRIFCKVDCEIKRSIGVVGSNLFALTMRMLIRSNTTEFYALHSIRCRYTPMSRM